MKSRLFYVSSALFIGLALCVSVWFFLYERRGEELHNQEESVRNRITTDHRNSSHREENEESLDKREKRRIQGIISSIRSIYSEEELADPETQRQLAVYDSPEFFEFMKDVHPTELTERQWNGFFESQGFPVKREYPEIFRHFFPTGEPEDYEPEMRLKFARMFIAQEPVDLTNPLAAAGQRSKILLEKLEEFDADMAWYAAQFEEDWDGIFLWRREDMKNNPALVWMTDVQRNAATGEATPKGDVSAPSWDLSSVMESPSVSPDTTAGGSPSIFSQSTDALEPPANPKPENDAAVTRAPGLTDVPKAPTALPTGASLEASLKEQFSSERFDRAMSTLEQYGPEEGLRRLRQSDPDFAKQIEQHRNREEVSK